MEDRIRQLLNQITALEGDLRAALHEHEANVLYRIKGRRVEFERSVREAHRRFKMGIFRWLVAVRPQNFLAAPVIYGMIIPLLLFDLCVTLFQAICFPIYRIAKARRADYIVFDRQRLEYLNAIKKFHCAYCAYANGLMAYACEIIARTEQYSARSSMRAKCLAPIHAMRASWLTGRPRIFIKNSKSSAPRSPRSRRQTSLSKTRRYCMADLTATIGKWSPHLCVAGGGARGVDHLRRHS